MLYKPKRMRQRTYDRICARLDAYEQIKDDRVLRVLAKLMGQLQPTDFDKYQRGRLVLASLPLLNAAAPFPENND